MSEISKPENATPNNGPQRIDIILEEGQYHDSVACPFCSDNPVMLSFSGCQFDDDDNPVIDDDTMIEGEVDPCEHCKYVAVDGSVEYMDDKFDQQIETLHLDPWDVEEMQEAPLGSKTVIVVAESGGVFCCGPSSQTMVFVFQDSV